MSKANGAIEKKDTFLQHVSLKNYKSIKDVEIDFKPGLNVIIGKNASGKTNFINGLTNGLNFKYDELWDSDFIVKAYFEARVVEIQAFKRSQSVEELKKGNYLLSAHKMSLKINDNEVSVDTYDDVLGNFLQNGFVFKEALIKYGIFYKENTPFINIPFSFTIITNGQISREIMSFANNQSYFLNNIFHHLLLNMLEWYEGLNVENIANESLKRTIILFFESQFKNINNVIGLYSPITSIRLNPDFNIIRESESQKQTVTNFYLEFLVDQSWLPFNLLSDGTKRLFYIISELLSTYHEIFSKDSDLNIVLLEEPELGIHPHQLHQLMQFIKEQSKEKQIILTTHSPQVLDAIEPDELDRIIICHSEPKNGTQLNHLTDEQIKKAKKYMTSEAFLSDYWRFSDLEPA
jgi:AAA15 family ATPase/GTPase